MRTFFTSGISCESPGRKRRRDTCALPASFSSTSNTLAGTPTTSGSFTPVAAQKAGFHCSQAVM